MRGKNKKPSSRHPANPISRCPDGLCRIGIDLLGSDASGKELLQAIIAFAAQLPSSIQLTLFGTDDLFKETSTYSSKQVLFHAVSEIIRMDDHPIHAIRQKKQSSLYLGVQMLKEQHLDAFISMGNTGALMAASKLLLSTFAGIERPALLALLPTRKAEIAVLDVGANTSYKAKHLVQFALMGIAYQKSRGIANPQVGLLNIGSEAKKGTPEVRIAYDYLREMSEEGAFRFIGNTEAREVFQGDVDVLVTDGFTGNVFLKTAEGIALVILEELERVAKEKALPSIKATLIELRHPLHYADYPGALLCGVKGIVIKCHGDVAAQSVLSSIMSAARLVEHRFLDRLNVLR